MSMFKFLKSQNGGLATEDAQIQKQNAVITEGIKIAEDEGWESKYPSLCEGLSNGTPQEQYVNAYTAIMMRNQAQFVEAAAAEWGESTVMANLGSVAPNILDVIRVFAPNTVAHILASAQPLTQMNGQVVVVKPTYSNSGGGVTAGQEVFKDRTDGNYASEVNSTSIGTGDGSDLTFTATLLQTRPGTLSVTVDGTEVGTDDGSGIVTGTNLEDSTINYDTGELSVTFTAGNAPGTGLDVATTYSANSEKDAGAIRELDIGLNVIPVTATSHPLRFSYSVQAQLALSSAVNLDVNDTLSVIAGQHLKIERDRNLINFIATQAGAVKASLTFDAANQTSNGISRRDVFNDFVITLAKAKKEIFDASGKGAVSWIVAGTSASVVISSMSKFVRDANVTPIGAHVIGSIDGITVVEDPGLKAEDFLVGYNGIMPGDSGVIIADWIPVYFTPTQQTADLVNKRALLSMYDMVVNQSTYYARGTISNL